jgi:hypothetical protein
MPELILRDAIADRVVEQARLKGYATPEAYLMDLLDTDIATIDFEDDLGLSFKRAFKDALQGKFHTYEEYKRMMADDDE